MFQNAKIRINNVLKTLERYAKTDLKYLIKGSFWLTLANVLTSGSVLVMSVTFAYLIPAETYGIYKYFISVLGILSISTLTGIGPILSQAVARGLEGSLFDGLKLKIKYGSLGGCASAGLALYYLLNDNHQLSTLFFIAAFFIPFMDSFHIYQYYLQGKKIFDKSSIYLSTSQAIATIIMIATVFVSSSIYAILVAYLVSWTMVRVYYFFKTVHKYPPNNLKDSRTISLGKHTSVIDVIATLIGSLDSILIFHYLGSAPLAIYSFAIAPVTQIVSLFRNIPTLATPKLANRPVLEIADLLNKRIVSVALISAIIVIEYTFISETFYEIFFPKYMESVSITKIYALTMLLTIPLTILSSAVNAKITYIPKKVLYIWNIPGAVSTIFMLLFIQSLGIMGVVYARILVLIITLFISYSLWIYILKKDKRMSAEATNSKI